MRSSVCVGLRPRNHRASLPFPFHRYFSLSSSRSRFLCFVFFFLVTYCVPIRTTTPVVSIFFVPARDDISVYDAMGVQ